jgi:hypothetical protein
MDTTNVTNVRVRCIVGSAYKAVQPVALQYRIGTTGDFTDIPAGFVADASTGPNLANLVTHVDVVLPTAAWGQSQVQIRVMTTNAAGSGEWIGDDDIELSAQPVPEPATVGAPSLGLVALWRGRRSRLAAVG